LVALVSYRAVGAAHTEAVFTVHATKKFLARVPEQVVPAGDLEPTTNRLSAWYVTVLFWRPQVALFVSERIRLPVLVPTAPAATVIRRMPDTLSAVLTGIGVDESSISEEIDAMRCHQVAKTASRSVLGTMNDFTFLAAHHRDVPGLDLVALSVELAHTPCGPLYSSHVFPGREAMACLSR
jgi:hypothetical protein